MVGSDLRFFMNYICTDWIKKEQKNVECTFFDVAFDSLKNHIPFLIYRNTHPYDAFSLQDIKTVCWQQHFGTFHVMYPSNEESAITLFTFHELWKRKDQNGKYFLFSNSNTSLYFIVNQCHIMVYGKRMSA